MNQASPTTISTRNFSPLRKFNSKVLSYLIRVVGKEDADLYLSHSLYPILLMGLENLAAQVEKMQTEPDTRVRGRFNACAYLAEYLMRNNPKYNPDKAKELTALYEQYSNRENIKRILNNRKVQLRSQFMKLESEDTNTQCQDFIQALDNNLELPNKISNTIDLTSIIATSFDVFWKKFIKAMKKQKKITWEELEEALEIKYPSYTK